MQVPPSAGSAGRDGLARAGQSLSALAVVPARIGSTRLARKMLLRETGLCLFEHTVRRVQASGVFARVVVATDSAEIAAEARRADIEVLLTSPDHPSGTDRVNEAVRILAERGESGFGVVVNVQGDEAEIDPAALGVLLTAFVDPEVEIATLAAPLASAEDLTAPQVVKVVCDQAGDALYFSRAPLAAAAGTPGAARHHLGVYGFRPAALARFCALPPGRLEAAEKLEQLRWLEAGRRLRVLPAARASKGIDTADDYREFVARWRSGAAEGAGSGRTARHGSHTP